MGDVNRQTLDLYEAAEMLGMAYETVRRWAREGKIPAFRIGANGRWRIMRVDLETFIQSQYAQTSERPAVEA